MNARRIAITGPKEAPAQAGLGGFAKPEAKPQPLHATQTREELLLRPIKMLNLEGVYPDDRAVCINRLENYGVNTVGDLLYLGEYGLARIPLAGAEVFSIALKKELASMGLALPAMGAGERETLVPNLARDLNQIGMSVRAANVIQKAGLRYAYQLVQLKKSELSSMRQCGCKTLKEIKDMLAGMNLSLGMELDGETLAEATRLANKPVGGQLSPARMESHATPGMSKGDRETLVERLATDLTGLGLPKSITKVLDRSDTKYAYQLVTKTLVELFRIPFCGRRTVKRMREFLEPMGLELQMKLDQGVLADAMLVASLNTDLPSAPASKRTALLSSPHKPSQPTQDTLPKEPAPISIVYLKSVDSIVKQAELADMELKGLIGIVSAEAMLNLVRFIGALKEGLRHEGASGDLKLGVARVNETGKALVQDCPDVELLKGFRRLYDKAWAEFALLEQHLRPKVLKQTRLLVDMLEYGRE